MKTKRFVEIVEGYRGFRTAIPQLEFTAIFCLLQNQDGRAW